MASPVRELSPRPTGVGEGLEKPDPLLLLRSRVLKTLDQIVAPAGDHISSAKLVMAEIRPQTFETHELFQMNPDSYPSVLLYYPRGFELEGQPKVSLRSEKPEDPANNTVISLNIERPFYVDNSVELIVQQTQYGFESESALDNGEVMNLSSRKPWGKTKDGREGVFFAVMGVNGYEGVGLYDLVVLDGAWKNLFRKDGTMKSPEHLEAPKQASARTLRRRASRERTAQTDSDGLTEEQRTRSQGRMDQLTEAANLRAELDLAGRVLSSIVTSEDGEQTTLLQAVKDAADNGTNIEINGRVDEKTEFTVFIPPPEVHETFGRDNGREERISSGFGSIDRRRQQGVEATYQALKDLGLHRDPKPNKNNNVPKGRNDRKRMKSQQKRAGKKK